MWANFCAIKAVAQEAASFSCIRRTYHVDQLIHEHVQCTRCGCNLRHLLIMGNKLCKGAAMMASPALFARIFSCCSSAVIGF
jgi:hypothetical protein